MEWKNFKDEKPEVTSGGFIVGVSSNGTTYTCKSGSYGDVEWFNKQPISFWMYIPAPPKTKKEYPAPKVGTVVTEENLDAFVEKFSIWLLFHAIREAYYFYDCNFNFVTTKDIINRRHLPFHVKRVEDTDTITWIQEEV